MGVLSGEASERVRGIQDEQEKKPLKRGAQPQASLSLSRGKLWRVDGIAELTGLLSYRLRAVPRGQGA